MKKMTKLILTLPLIAITTIVSAESSPFQNELVCQTPYGQRSMKISIGKSNGDSLRDVFMNIRGEEVVGGLYENSCVEDSDEINCEVGRYKFVLKTSEENIANYEETGSFEARLRKGLFRTYELSCDFSFTE